MPLRSWALLLVLVGCTITVFASSSVKTSKQKVALDSLSGTVYDAVTKSALAGAQIRTADPKYTTHS